MKTIVAPLAVCVVLFATTIFAEEPAKSDPRENLETYFPECIRLLEAKDYVGFLKTLIAPNDLADMARFSKMDEQKVLEMMASSADQQAEKSIKMLKSFETMKPAMSDDGSVATYELKEPIDGRNSLRFQKVGKYWYAKSEVVQEKKAVKKNAEKPAE